MTLRRFVSLPSFAVLLLGVAALGFVGCDSNGSSPPDPTTFQVTIENVGVVSPLLKSGVVNTPVGAAEPGPLTPGNAYEVSFTAGTEELPGVGASFSFALMFIHSNDMFYAFQPGGLPLFDNGTPISGDVTDQVYMWDAGTEEDQEPGNGSNQPMQGGAESGPDDANSLVQVEANDSGVLEDDGFTYPDVSDVVEVTVSSTEDAASGGYRFTVRIENVSEGTTINGKPIPLSPGTWAVHFDHAPTGDDVTYPDFAPGGDANDTGLEDIAEDGAPTVHAETLSGLTGVTVPLSPGAYAVHSTDFSLHDVGAEASAGLEGVAEDGDPQALSQMLAGAESVKSSGAFTTPDGADGPGPLPPGNSYSFTVEAVPGDRLSLATMYVQSNDLYYAFGANGIALFNAEDDPLSGDVTQQIGLYDAGTEGDQEPGVGLAQAPRQSAANTGPDGEGSIVAVDGENDGYSYPAPVDIMRVTVTPPATL